MPAPARTGRLFPARRRPPAVTPVPFSVTAISWPRGDPMYGYESALRRAGFAAVAGVDEAGRGACAGPLVVAACVLSAGVRIAGLDDSKVLSRATRERLYDVIVRRASAYRVVELPATEIDAYGLHVANLAGMRRAVSALAPTIDYALTDGFAVPGMAVPATAVCKGDATVACIAAASILAKVTRDRIMVGLHSRYPAYGFDRHKGYVTADHEAALGRHGPCPQHRRRYVNVRRAGAAFLANGSDQRGRSAVERQNRLRPWEGEAAEEALEQSVPSYESPPESPHSWSPDSPQEWSAAG